VQPSTHFFEFIKNVNQQKGLVKSGAKIKNRKKTESNLEMISSHPYSLNGAGFLHEVLVAAKRKGLVATKTVKKGKEALIGRRDMPA